MDPTSQPSTSQESPSTPRRRRCFHKKKNFSEQEVEVLVDEVVPRFDVLLGRQRKALPLSSKNKIWTDIMVAVNSLGVEQRSVLELKKKWTDIRSAVKTKMSLRAKSNNQTGGGPGVAITLSPVEEKVASTFQSVQIVGFGCMDTLALSRQAANTPEETEMEEEETMPDVAVELPSPEQPTSPPTTRETESPLSVPDLGLTPTQNAYLHDYSQRADANMQLLGAKLDKLDASVQGLIQTISESSQQKIDATKEMNCTLTKLLQVLVQKQELPSTSQMPMPGCSNEGQSGDLGGMPSSFSPVSDTFEPCSISDKPLLHLSSSNGDSPKVSALVGNLAGVSVDPSTSVEGEQGLVNPPTLLSPPSTQVGPSTSSAASFLLDVKDSLSTTISSVPQRKRRRRK